MASLKFLRNRISSVKSTQKITKAMKMVAAAKLRKAQQNAENARPYSEKLNSPLQQNLTFYSAKINNRSKYKQLVFAYIWDLYI